ncbi:hypothetical protein [Bradyrhizobium sp. Ai1a-2]|nr:hypothetical protein [Bradyrhizobium sp. Ai1a-2]
MIEGGRADIVVSRPDASQARTKWTLWPFAAILVTALLWGGIYWIVRAFS